MDELILYEPIRREDEEEIAALYEAFLNRGRYIHDHVVAGIESEDYIGYRAICKGRTAGFSSGRRGIDFTCPHPFLEDTLRKTFPENKIYTPDALLVLPEFRNRGIAAGLGNRLMEAVKEKGYRFILLELWIYPDGSVPAKPVTARWGRELFERTIRNFYRDAQKYGIECPVCGKNCSCGAKIIVLEIAGQKTQCERR